MQRYEEVAAELAAAQERLAVLERERAELENEVRYWRGRVLDYWANSASKLMRTDSDDELDRMRQTVSWRVTAPLRSVRRRLPSKRQAG